CPATLPAFSLSVSIMPVVPPVVPVAPVRVCVPIGPALPVRPCCPWGVGSCSPGLFMTYLLNSGVPFTPTVQLSGKGYAEQELLVVSCPQERHRAIDHCAGPDSLSATH